MSCYLQVQESEALPVVPEPASSPAKLRQGSRGKADSRRQSNVLFKSFDLAASGVGLLEMEEMIDFQSRDPLPPAKPLAQPHSGLQHPSTDAPHMRENPAFAQKLRLDVQGLPEPQDSGLAGPSVAAARPKPWLSAIAETPEPASTDAAPSPLGGGPLSASRKRRMPEVQQPLPAAVDSHAVPSRQAAEPAAAAAGPARALAAPAWQAAESGAAAAAPASVLAALSRQTADPAAAEAPASAFAAPAQPAAEPTAAAAQPPPVRESMALFLELESAADTSASVSVLAAGSGQTRRQLSAGPKLPAPPSPGAGRKKRQMRESMALFLQLEEAVMLSPEAGTADPGPVAAAAEPKAVLAPAGGSETAPPGGLRESMALFLELEAATADSSPLIPSSVLALGGQPAPVPQVPATLPLPNLNLLQALEPSSN